MQSKRSVSHAQTPQARPPQIQDVASLLLTLDKSALQTMKLVISVAKGKLPTYVYAAHTWKWILMTKIRTWILIAMVEGGHFTERILVTC